MKQIPEERIAVRERAISVVAEAAKWCIYSMWHPAYGTRDFKKAWRDYTNKIPMADVYFARGLKMPADKYGISRPEDP